jgi:hypothetical protein
LRLLRIGNIKHQISKCKIHIKNQNWPSDQAGFWVQGEQWEKWFNNRLLFGHWDLVIVWKLRFGHWDFRLVRVGIFKQEIVPVPVPQKKSDQVPFDTNERPMDTSLEKTGKLRPA